VTFTLAGETVAVNVTVVKPGTGVLADWVDVRLTDKVFEAPTTTTVEAVACPPFVSVTLTVAVFGPALW
jgi:hypothetical protein